MTTLVNKPVLHGRDHCHGGADPIPCLTPQFTGNFEDRILAQPSLVGYWPMDDPSGNAHDASGNSRPLSPVDTPAYSQPGPFPDKTDVTSIEVTGTDQVATSTPTHDSFVGDYAPLNLAGSDMTVMFYIYPTAYPPLWGGITSYGGGSSGLSHTAQIRADGKIFWAVGNVATAQTTVAPPLNTWTHVACTRSTSGLYIYFNGVQVASAATDTVASTSNHHFNVGVMVGLDSFSAYYKGRVGQVALFNAALSESEIAGIWGGGEYGSGAGSVLTIDEDGNQVWAPPAAATVPDPAADSWVWMPLADSDGTLILDSGDTVIPTLIPI